MRELEIRVLGFFGVVLLLSCGAAARAKQGHALPVTSNMIAERVAVAHDDERPTATERNPRYKICRDDILLLSFPLSPELNQRVIVQPDGFVSLQGAGSLYVAGLTLPGVVEAVKKAYGNMLHDPIVDVDLADFQKPFFTVLGQVGKPGQYDLRYDITVTQAVAVAGGFTPKAKTQVFLYRAVSSNWAEVRAQAQRYPARKEYHRRHAPAARRHDLRSGKIYHKVPTIRSLHYRVESVCDGALKKV